MDSKVVEARKWRAAYPKSVVEGRTHRQRAYPIRLRSDSQLLQLDRQAVADRIARLAAYCGLEQGIDALPKWILIEPLLNRIDGQSTV